MALKLVFFVPTEHKESVKEALFSCGAGKIGRYQNCSFETKGMGQFMALQGARPTIGAVHRLQTVEEYRVEILMEDGLKDLALVALKDSHPYEEPAYEFYQVIL